MWSPRRGSGQAGLNTLVARGRPDQSIASDDAAFHLVNRVPSVDYGVSVQSSRPLVVVDAANVVGSVPDGWWRDRAGATTRLRDALTDLASSGLAGIRPPLEVVLVVEGAARSVGGTEGVRVVAADGSGDDAIVALVRTEAVDRPCVVVTADRELRARVTALGADVLGPKSIRRR